MNKTELKLDQNYGPLKEGFAFTLQKGYSVLVGENDSGKSAILQFIFKKAMETSELGANAVCYVPADRDHVDGTIETAGSELQSYNQKLYDGILKDRILGYASDEAVPRILPKLLITHHEMVSQIGQLNDFLARLELAALTVSSPQRPVFSNVDLYFHGSGLRGLFYVLAALSDPAMKVILIDEPERSLEARLQKKLRDLLIEEAKERAIIVATHSHLFLNDDPAESNLIVQKDPLSGAVSTRTVGSRELAEIIYTLLGNSTQDLLFPGNFLVVEGASDQIICNRVASLSGVSPDRVKVLASCGIEKSDRLVNALENNLRSLIAGYSPYANKVVVLLDAPNGQTKAKVQEIQDKLSPTRRCFVLDQDSIEKYLPPDLYSKANLAKEDVLKRLGELQSKKRQREEYKKEISTKIADILAADDLDGIATVRSAILRANELIGG